jgi:HEAT repeat protein
MGIRALKYEDRGIRREAAEALKDIGDERATKALEEYYDELAVEEDLEYNNGRPSCLYF